MKKILKSKIFWTIIIIMVAGIAYASFKPEPKPEYTTVIVEKQDLIQTVSVTGTVRGADEIDLNFKTTGTLNELLVDIGDPVKTGDVLAKLSARQLENSVKEAQASLLSAQATLDKLVKGASIEDIAISQERVDSAEVTLAIKEQEYKDLLIQQRVDELAKRDIIISSERDLSTALDNLVRTMENELFDATAALNRIYEILNDTDAESTLGASNSITKSNAEASHTLGETKVTNAWTAVNTANILKSEINIEAALEATYIALNQVSQALTDTYTMLANTPASTIYTETEINTDKTNISADQATISASVSAIQTSEISWESKQTALTTAQNNLTTFIANKDSNLNTAQGMINNAKASLDLAKAELALKQAPARIEDIKQQQARVSQAAAVLARIRADLEDVTLIAPLDGIITQVNYDLGEKTDLTRPVMAILGGSGLEIEVDIPESDIAKVKLNQTAHITLDAFGDDMVFPGQVTFIDPAETVIQDVVYYRVKVTFTSESQDVKPGMTANIDITTANKENVLVVPQRAVKQNSVKYVELLVNEQELKREVTTGLRGDGGLIEIVSGLEGGETVITFKK